MKRGRLQSDPRRKRDGGNAISERRQPISKCSPAQQDKCHGQPCVHCGAWPTDATPSDPMHLSAKGYRGGCNDPLCTVPGCRWCHRDFDDGKLDLSRDVSGPHFKDELAHMLAHYDGDWVAMGERLTGQKVAVVSHERAKELGL